MVLGIGRRKLPKSLSYEESRELAENGSDKTRADLAARIDVRPEVLYFLAEDPSTEVRRRIAANAKAPRQADLMLARDADEVVRAELASKVAKLTALEGRGVQERAQRFVEQTLEVLARDQATRVRRILAEALKSVAGAPPQVIQQLARDAEDVVACPVLEFSPLLSDDDLLEIIASSGVSSRLCAISRRSGLGETISDAIVQRNDRAAVAEVVRRRIEEGGRDSSATADAAAPGANPAEEVARLKKAGRLNGETVSDAVLAGQRDFVRHALSAMAGVGLDYVDRVLQGHSAKGITALAWKAGCSMRVALQLQTNMGGIPPHKALHARDGSDFPLTPEEMEWQLDFFASLGQQ